jgi:glutathione synthase/RimK-type ligase-like ATP-grasp enzyme
MKMTSLLILASEFETEQQRFEEYFEEVEKKSLADVLIDVGTDMQSEILVDGKDIQEWDAVYIDPEPKAFYYTRVLMEIINDKEVDCNLDTSSVFILSKKPYLFNVLAERGVKIPTQVAISTEKGLTEIERDIDFPVLAKKYTDLQLSETQIFQEFDELKSFSELAEHGEDFIMVQEYEEEKDVFDILYIDGKVISLKLSGSPWEEGEISRSYYTLSDDLKQAVEKATDSIGTRICRIRVLGDRIVDMDNQPELEMFKQKSGKNVYGRIADVLKEGGEEN